MGLKVFTKVTEQGETFYRVAQEALGWIDRFFTKRIVAFSQKDLLLLLKTTNETDETPSSKHLPFCDCSPDVQKQLTQLSVGPAVLRVSVASETMKTAKTALEVNVWIGKNAILPRVSKSFRQEILKQLKEIEK